MIAPAVQIAPAPQPRPVLRMVDPYKRVALKISPDFWEELRDFCLAFRDYSMTKFQNDAVRIKLEAMENEALELPPGEPGGRTILKPAGTPFPRAQGKVKQGVPPDHLRDGEVRVTKTMRLEPELAERWYDAVYWTNSFLSYLSEEALREHFERLQS